MLGSKISQLRAKIVHFDESTRIGINLKELEELNGLFELVIVDYIFSKIGVSDKLRSAIKNHVRYDLPIR